MHAQQISTEVCSGEQNILQASGDQVASVGTQPNREPARLSLTQLSLQPHRIRRTGLPFVVKKLADGRADVTATGHGRHQVETMQ
ncbi:hypothetical protein D3C80_1931780 [compost metagenome]